MEKSWIDIQEDTPKAEGEYDMLIQSLGDRSLQRESTAHWKSSRFKMEGDGTGKG